MPDAAHSNQTSQPTAASEEQPPPYGNAQPTPSRTQSNGTAAAPPRRIRTLDLIKAKAEGRRWAMLTSYDQYTAALFEQAGVEALLIGDSADDHDREILFTAFLDQVRVRKAAALTA